MQWSQDAECVESAEQQTLAWLPSASPAARPQFSVLLAKPHASSEAVWLCIGLIIYSKSSNNFLLRFQLLVWGSDGPPEPKNRRTPTEPNQSNWRGFQEICVVNIRKFETESKSTYSNGARRFVCLGFCSEQRDSSVVWLDQSNIRKLSSYIYLAKFRKSTGGWTQFAIK